MISFGFLCLLLFIFLIIFAWASKIVLFSMLIFMFLLLIFHFLILSFLLIILLFTNNLKFLKTHSNSFKSIFRIKIIHNVLTILHIKLMLMKSKNVYSWKYLFILYFHNKIPKLTAKINYIFKLISVKWTLFLTRTAFI